MFHRLHDGIEMYYEIQGNPEGKVTLVFLNGLSQSTASWAAIAPGFYSACRIVLIDLVFQGQSGSAASFRSYDEHASDVYSLLRELKPANPILCGLSYGSAVAQHALVNYPGFFSGGILLSTFAHNTGLFNAIGESWKIALKAGGYPLMLDVMLPVVLGKTYFDFPIIPVATLKEMRVTRDLETESLLKLMEATETRGDYRKKLAAISVPVLVAQGEEDILIPPSVAEEVAQNIPGATFEIIPKVGHTLNLEAIPQTIQLIRNFIMAFEKNKLN
jgi:3-oxoadipate enol-lactonase